MLNKTFGTKESGKAYYDRKGAYLIAAANGKIATVRTSKGYFLIGGKIEEGESHEACIERECKEETGCGVSVIKYLYSAEAYSFHEKLGYFHPMQYYYFGEIDTSQENDGEEDCKFEWLPFEKINGKFFSEVQQWAVEEYLRICGEV